MKSRINITTYFLRLASIVALRSTCERRQVGCVLVDKYKHIIGTGYNGVASGQPHCIESKCPGASYPSGKGLEKCEAIHAEQNAILQCKDVNAIVTCYVTVAPCITCTKLLMNTSCKEIVFLEEYPNSGKKLWDKYWYKYNDISGTFK